MVILSLTALIVAIYAYFIVAVALTRGRPLPDLSAYPTTAMRFSALIMGALLSGVGEEMAFRGYMQSQLERFGPMLAIGITSIVFTLAHAPQDLHQFARLAIGYFVLALLWGTLAYRAGRYGRACSSTSRVISPQATSCTWVGAVTFCLSTRACVETHNRPRSWPAR